MAFGLFADTYQAFCKLLVGKTSTPLSVIVKAVMEGSALGPDDEIEKDYGDGDAIVVYNGTLLRRGSHFKGGREGRGVDRQGANKHAPLPAHLLLL